MALAKIRAHKPRLGVNAVFNNAQMEEIDCQQKSRKELAKIYHQSSPDLFTLEFLQCIARLLVEPEKLPCVDRALTFAATFLAQNFMEMEHVSVAVCEFIFEYHNCQTQIVRFRCCQLLYSLLVSMDDQAGLCDDIYEKILSTMLERLQDKAASVRAEAVLALRRLQSPTDPKCLVIKAFLFHMEKDPNPDVRARIVKHIAVTQKTLPALFERICDVSNMVRKEAFKALSSLRMVKLSINQRQKMLFYGINDSSEVVKKFVLENMGFTWYKQNDGNYLQLLKALDVESMDEDVLESVLFHLFEKQPTSTLVEIATAMLSKDNLIPIDRLTMENVTFWLYVVKFIRKSANDEEPDDPISLKLLPELTRYVKYLKDFSLKLKKHDLDQEFLVIQLFKIADTYSLDDEMGRELLRQMSTNYLIDENVGLRCVPVIAGLFEKMVPSVKDRMAMLAEMVSDIREPLQPSEEPEVSVVGKSDGQQDEMTSEPPAIESGPKTDVETLLKCLTIIKEFLCAKDVIKIDATLLSLKDLFIVQCLSMGSAEVQNLALEVMTFYFIRDVELAKEKYVYCCFLLLDASRRYSALASVFDMLVIHGFAPFSADQTPPNSNKSRKDDANPLNDFQSDPTLTPSQLFFVKLVTECLESEEDNVRARACLGLAKLLYAGVLNSPLILARLILIWFSPSSATVPEIRQMLSLFLNVYPSKNKNAGSVLSESILPLLKAHKSMSPEEKEEIDPLSVAKLIVSLLRSDICLPPDDVKERGSYHLRVAVKISRELLVINGIDHYLLSRILHMLELEPDDARHSSELMTMLARGIKKMGKFWDKKVLKVVQSMKSQLEKMEEDLAERNSSDLNRTTSRLTIADTSGVQELSVAFSERRTTAQIIEESLLGSPASPGAPPNMVVDETNEDIEESFQSPSASHSNLKRGAVVDDSDGSDVECAGGGVVPQSDDDSGGSGDESKSTRSSDSGRFKEPLPPDNLRITRSTRKKK